MSCFVHQSDQILGSKDGDGGERQLAARNLHLYNNWSSNFSLLIGRELWSIRIQIMEIMWWWQDFFSFSLLQEWLRNFAGHGRKDLSMLLKKNQHFSMVDTLINHRIDIKTLQWKHSPAAHGSTWVLNILTSFLWSITAQTIVNSCQFVNFLCKW